MHEAARFGLLPVDTPQEDIQRLLPSKVDKERFGTLMAIVADTASDNRKVAALKENMDEVGQVLVRILKLLL